MRPCRAASQTTLLIPCNACGASFHPRMCSFVSLGADSFLTLKRWHRCAELLLFCDFIVAGRPGFSLEQINAALPDGVKITSEDREAGFTRFGLSGPDGQSAACFCSPTWTRTSLPPRFVRHGLTASEQQTVLAPAVVGIHSLPRPLSASGDTIETKEITTRPNGNYGNSPHGVGRCRGLRRQKG